MWAHEHRGAYRRLPTIDWNRTTAILLMQDFLFLEGRVVSLDFSDILIENTPCASKAPPHA
jgi:hypothetical protein